MLTDVTEIWWTGLIAMVAVITFAVVAAILLAGAAYAVGRMIEVVSGKMNMSPDALVVWLLGFLWFSVAMPLLIGGIIVMDGAGPYP